MSVDTTINTLTIKTPEGVVFSYPLAGPVTRFLAWTVDAASIVVIGSVVSSVLRIVSAISGDVATALNILAYFLISIGYGILLEWYWQGQTLGKRLLNLRVMDAQGLHLRFNQVVIRNLLRFVDSLPLLYMVGGITSLLSRHAQRLGDIAANTIVVWNPKITEPDLDQLLGGKYNSLRDYPHLGARLRQRVSAEEASIALQAVLRREEFSPEARVELFRDLAGHFKEVVTFPQEATDGISEEQYIRNVVDLLFRARTPDLRSEQR